MRKEGGKVILVAIAGAASTIAQVLLWISGPILAEPDFRAQDLEVVHTDHGTAARNAPPFLLILSKKEMLVC